MAKLSVPENSGAPCRIKMRTPMSLKSLGSAFAGRMGRPKPKDKSRGNIRDLICALVDSKIAWE